MKSAEGRISGTPIGVSQTPIGVPQGRDLLGEEGLRSPAESAPQGEPSVGRNAATAARERRTATTWIDTRGLMSLRI